MFLFPILFIPLIFFLYDLLHTTSSGKRTSAWIRAPFEIITLLIYPYLFYMLVIGLSQSLINTPIIISTIILTPCIIAYFIANYSTKILTETKEGIINLLLVLAILINIVLSIIISIYSHFIISLIGNFPILISYGITLILNLKNNNCHEIADQ